MEARNMEARKMSAVPSIACALRYDATCHFKT